MWQVLYYEKWQPAKSTVGKIYGLRMYGDDFIKAPCVCVCAGKGVAGECVCRGGGPRVRDNSGDSGGAVAAGHCLQGEGEEVEDHS